MAAKPLSEKQAGFRKQLLARIHLSDAYRSVYADDRPAWEKLLQDHFGTSSSASLRIDELIRLRDWLEHRRAGLDERPSQQKIEFIKRLWAQRARQSDEKSLLSFARKNTGLALIGLNALTVDQANGLIAAIKRM